MRRPQEKEKKQEDRAELLEMGVHLPSHSSFLLALLGELSLHLFILPLWDPHMHAWKRTLNRKYTLGQKREKNGTHQVISLFPTHITER